MVTVFMCSTVNCDISAATLRMLYDVIYNFIMFILLSILILSMLFTES